MCPKPIGVEDLRDKTTVRHGDLVTNTTVSSRSFQDLELGHGIPLTLPKRKNINPPK